MEDSVFKRRLARGASCACATLLLMGGAVGISSCSDDLLTGTPSWLGSSIYEELEGRGNFTQTLALINDPDLTETNYPDLLRRTGSMTLFVADDAAWKRFYEKRGITSLAQLSKAEKKNLLKGAMINNAYLIELLSNTPGDPPEEGACMRRASRVDVEDSIPVVLQADMPVVNPARMEQDGSQTDYWSSVRDRASIKIYKDNNAAPMMHFLPEYMSTNNFTSQDLLTLTNGKSSDVTGSSYINGIKVVEQDVTCQNGYIHVLADVPEQLDNMAEIIAKQPQFSIFHQLLERFSYPQTLVIPADPEEDTIFVKRYFYSTTSSDNTHDFTVNPLTQKSVTNVLSFDPGWNTSTAGNLALAQDANALFVPTDKALTDFLRGEGSSLGYKYDYDWKNIPDNVVLPMLKNCFQTSLRASVPSKFASVKNTASESMGIQIDDVDSCFLACNGAVFQVNKVFMAPEYQSVFYPAVLRGDEDLRTIYTAIHDETYKGKSEWTLNEYSAYLNSMGTSYSFMLPNDNAFSRSALNNIDSLIYIDPYSFRASSTEGPTALRFYVDPSNSDSPVSVEALKIDIDSTGVMTITDQLNDKYSIGSGATYRSLVSNRIQDILDNTIVTHGLRGTQTFREGQEYYLNKAGGPIKVRFEGGKVTGIAGSYQIEQGRYIPVDAAQIFDQTESGNGVSYVLNEIPMSTLTSPYAILNDTVKHAQFSKFADLLSSCSFVGANDGVTGHSTIDRVIRLFANYHYTIYAPTNDAIDAVTARKDKDGNPQQWIPTWDTDQAWIDLRKEIEEIPDSLGYTEEELERMDSLCNACHTAIENAIDLFVRYHIQDGSVLVGGADSVAVHETACMDEAISRFRRITVTTSGGAISLQDAAGNTAHVTSDAAQNNLFGRQYIFVTSSKAIYGSSYVVVHEIDRALEFGSDMFLKKDFPEPTLESVLRYLNIPER